MAGSTLVVGGLLKVGRSTLAGIWPPQATAAGAVGAPALASSNWVAGAVVVAPATVVAVAPAGVSSSPVSHSPPATAATTTTSGQRPVGEQRPAPARPLALGLPPGPQPVQLPLARLLRHPVPSRLR